MPKLGNIATVTRKYQGRTRQSLAVCMTLSHIGNNNLAEVDIGDMPVPIVIQALPHGYKKIIERVM